MKSQYTTKDQRNEFMIWLINNYGYNIENVDNSRVLSEKYYKSTNNLIPKISIYRWIKGFDKYKLKPYQLIAEQFIKSTDLRK